jgi:hypothetical protein
LDRKASKTVVLETWSGGRWVSVMAASVVMVVVVEEEVVLEAGDKWNFPKSSSQWEAEEVVGPYAPSKK